MHVLAFDGSPAGAGRTAAVLRAVLDGLPPGCTSELVSLAASPEPALARMGAADAFVVGSPMYRASFAAPLKVLLDQLPRGMWGEQTAPITGRAVAIVGTGATWHHFLGLDPLRSVLASFFAAHVLPPGLYVPGEGFDASGEPVERFRELARAQGRALADLDRALTENPGLRALVPQA